MNVRVFVMIAGSNETKSLVKRVLCDCRCKLNSNESKSKQKWDKGQCRCKCKIQLKKQICKENYVWRRSKCACEFHKKCSIDEHLNNFTCVKHVVDNSVIT